MEEIHSYKLRKIYPEIYLYFQKTTDYLIEKIDCIKNLVNLEKKSLNLKMKREIDTIENIQIYKNDEEIVESLLKNGNQFIYLR